jgi:predicted hotdog family 3-hydroxylacyl-ACP dehydratase
MTMNRALDAAGIAARIPHQGTMCLLDGLLDWSATHVLCRASSHADSANPLRSPAGLLAPVAIEYAAQAMALHGSLVAAPGAVPPGPGFLASARDVRLHVARLDEAPGPLRVRAERLAGDGGQALYRFTLHDAAGRLLVEGRATVVLNQALPR